MPISPQSAGARYGVAAAVIVLAVVVRLLLDPALGDAFPFATLFLAVLVAAWYGGFGPALFATLVGSALAARFLLQPRDSFAVPGSDSRVGFLLYLLVGTGMSVLGGLMHRSRERAFAEAAASRAQRDEFRTTLASIGDAVIVTDAAGRVLSINAVASGLTGWAEADAAGRPLAEVFRIVNERTRAPVADPVAKVLGTGVVVGLANHTVLISRDGTERPIDDSAAPVRGPDGRLRGVVLVFRDATAARRADAARRYLAAIVEGSEDAIVAKALDGTITSWNAAAERLYGYTAAEVVGKPFSVLVPADRADEADKMARRLRQGDRIDHYETVRQRKDGTRVPVSVSYSPIRDQDGQLIGSAVITRDVSEQKQAVAALRASEARFAALINHSPVVMFLKDPAGVYLMANPQYAAYAGRPVEEIVGRTDHDLFPGPVADRFREEDAAVLANRAVRTFEESFEYDGRRFTFLTSKFPLPGASGEPVGVCGLSTDISDRRAAEERLRDEVRITDTLNRLGPRVAAELDLGTVVQLVTDEATRLTEAQFGAFFYNVHDPAGEGYTLHGPSRAPREAFTTFPMPRNSAVFEPTFRGEGVVRLADVTQDPRYGQNPPHAGMPASHLAVRSYLAVPVVSRSGEVLGGLFFGHAEVGVFTDRHERLVVGMAAHAAIAIDNARLYGQVQESEGRFRQLAEHITDVFWLRDVQAGRVLYISPAYEDVWGRPCQSLYADPDSFLEGVHPHDRGRVEEAARRLSAGDPWAEEYRVARPDGSVRWVVDRGYPIRDAAGAVTRVAGIVEDVTVRKRDEINTRFLADASAVLAALTDEGSALQKVATLAVPHFADWCAVDMVNPDGSLRRVAVAHVDPAKVRLAHEIYERWPPDPNAPHGAPRVVRTGQAELIPEITNALLAAASDNPDRLRVLHDLGLRSYLAVPLTVRGTVIGAVVFVAADSGRRYDETDLGAAADLARRAGVAIENARLYQAVRDADRRKDEFLATLAHELRNPLAPIRTALSLLKTTGASGPTVDRALDMMGRQTEHLTRLVDDLLDVSRVMRGKIELKPARVDLAAVAARGVETAQPLIDARRQKLTVVVPDAPVWVEADPVRFAQVVGNLLTNAAKYTEPGGEIRLSVEPAAGQALLRVADTGVGIAPDVLPKVFDLFFQADTSAAGTQGGLGIGLTLVKSLVELHGGSVEARSPGAGRGSEFVVRLPLQGKEGEGISEETKPAPPSSVFPPPSSGSRRVLVVDDHADAADSLAMLLRMEGHDVRVARSGPSALAAAQADPPDVVLLDLGMPGMDGYEVARRLRQGPAAGVFIAALTGWGQEDDRRRTREAGFDHHLVKPADPDDLRKLLAGVPIGRRQPSDSDRA